MSVTMSKTEKIAKYLSNFGYETSVYQEAIIETKVPRIGQVIIVVDTLDVWAHKKRSDFSKEQKTEYSKFKSKVEDVLVREGLIPRKDIL